MRTAVNFCNKILILVYLNTKRVSESTLGEREKARSSGAKICSQNLCASCVLNYCPLEEYFQIWFWNKRSAERDLINVVFKTFQNVEFVDCPIWAVTEQWGQQREVTSGPPLSVEHVSPLPEKTGFIGALGREAEEDEAYQICPEIFSTTASGIHW